MNIDEKIKANKDAQDAVNAEIAQLTAKEKKVIDLTIQRIALKAEGDALAHLKHMDVPNPTPAEVEAIFAAKRKKIEDYEKAKLAEIEARKDAEVKRAEYIKRALDSLKAQGQPPPIPKDKKAGT